MGLSPPSSRSDVSGRELDYAQIVVSFVVVDTLEATGTAAITSSAVTYDGAPVILEFFCSVVTSPSNAVQDLTRVTLFEGAAQLTRLGLVRTPVAGQQERETILSRFRFTPAAGVHTYKIAAFANSLVGAPTLFAGAGGALADPPAYMRITKV